MDMQTKGQNDMGTITRRPSRIRASAAALIAVGLIAVGCTTPGAPGGFGGPPLTVDYVMDANRLHVVDMEDAWGDLPYLIHIAFRVQYGKWGSAEVWAVPMDPPILLTCPGTPNPFDSEDEWCIDTEVAAIPDSSGRVVFDDLRVSTLENLIEGELPEIAGVLTFAFEHEWLFNGDNYTTDLMTTAIEGLLNQYIASGQLPLDGSLAAPIIVDDTTEMLVDMFAELAIVLLFGGGILDSYIGMSPMVVAAVGGGLGNLLDAAGWNELPLENGFAFITAHNALKTVRYTEQHFGPFDIGSPNTIYDIDWDMHTE